MTTIPADPKCVHRGGFEHRARPHFEQGGRVAWSTCGLPTGLAWLLVRIGAWSR